MSETKRRRPMLRIESHYCDWDQPGRRVVRALCTALIKRRDHSNDPTCITCRLILAGRDKSAR